jgi:glycosyltransferase involved in cell wall biosynthesis
LIAGINRKKPVDLISAHWIYPDGYGASLIAKHMNIPLTLHARGCDINEYTKYFLRRKLIRSALRRASLVFSVSSEIRDKVTRLGIPGNRTRVVLNGVDQQVFRRVDRREARQRLSLNGEGRYLLYVGNLQHEKGVNFLVEAAAIARRIEFTLLIVGDGPERHGLEKQIEDKGLEDRILILGRKPHGEIPDYLAASDLLCLPSLREGCPNIILESLSVGTPVLSSRVGAVPDIVTRPEWGVMVPPGDAAALAGGIEQAIDLKAGPVPEFQWYDWGQCADLVLEDFSTIVDKERLSGSPVSIT